MVTIAVKTILLLGSLLACALCSVAATESTEVTEAQLKQQPKYPDDFYDKPYAERIAWLQQQLALATDAARRYQLGSSLGFQHYSAYANEPLRQACAQTPPQAFDLDYRFICTSANGLDYHSNMRDLMALYDDAIAAANIDLATQVLSGMAWKQSEHGDIASAFRSYGLALSLANQASPEALNDVMLNTAALYVMHGDQTYVEKGVQLQKATIERLEQLVQQKSNATDLDYASQIIGLIQHNVGVAYALHLLDYQQALDWFGKVKPEHTEVWRSALVFSALSAAELGQKDKAADFVAKATAAAKSSEIDSDYLDCYLQLVQMKTGHSGELKLCQQFDVQAPLEVRLDIYKRLAAMSEPEWRLLGLEKLHGLFISRLESQLKQSSSQAASHTELNRLELESDLKTELLETELSLKKAEQEKRQSQTLLIAAIMLILVLVILAVVIQLRQKRTLAQQYKLLSVRDGLTGLHNRRYFEQNIERELNYIRRCQQQGRSTTLAFFLFDIDFFKKINDLYGHQSGDEVLIEFSKRITTVIRDTDLLIRWGGEEFLLVARTEQASDPHQMAERIRQVICQQPFVVAAQQQLDVSCTIGVSVYPCVEAGQQKLDWGNLVQLADAALYLGKQKQRNCWVCVDSIAASVQIADVLQQGLETSAQQQQISLTSQFELTTASERA